MELPFFGSPTDAKPSQVLHLRPGKIIGVGRNYRAHAAEMGNDVPNEPLLFLKASSGLVQSGAPIARPAGFERVDFEGEIGVVIERRGRRISEADALGHVLGYTCVNDLTIRDLQRKDKQWTRAKGFDGSCAVGPRVVGGIDPASLAVETRKNGKRVQSAPATDMVFSIPLLIAYISELMTLEEGDLIATGTPAGVGSIEPGDRVEVEVTQVGVLENPIVAES